MTITLAEGRAQLRRVLEQIQAVRWQLIGIKLSLREEKARNQDLDDEMDAVTELRATIDCVLDDDLRPALQDLEGALASTGDEEEEEDDDDQ